jgi:hypothetical protein
MPDICEIALQTIREQMPEIPAEDVAISDVFDSDWDGSPRIKIVASQADIEEEPIGVLTSTLTIHTLAAKRHQAIELGAQAAIAVLRRFEAMEHNDASGVLAIMPTSTKIENVHDRNIFNSLYSFEVLHY